MTNDNMPPWNGKYLEDALDQLGGEFSDLERQANHAIQRQDFQSLERLNKLMATMSHQLATIRREQALISEAEEVQRQLDNKKKAWVYFFLLAAVFKKTGGTNVRSAEPAKPPALAECLTRIVTKPKLVDRVLDARAEKFERHIEIRGLRRARAFYWVDTVKSCWPALKGLGRWLVAGEIVRRWLGS